MNNDDILLLIRSCRHNVDSIGKAYSSDALITKIYSQRLDTVILSSGACLVDIVTNFRTIDGKQLGYLETKRGRIPIPQFWPATSLITKEWGIPYRSEYQPIIVDAYVVNEELRKVILDINKPPMYPTFYIA